MCEIDSPFYLAINWRHSEGLYWYKAQPLGKLMINAVMQTLAAHVNLSGRKTNHSARKTSVEMLCRNNFLDSMVMLLTGHRNVHSLNAYKKPSLEQQEEMSHLLRHYSASTEISRSETSVSSKGVTKSLVSRQDTIFPSSVLNNYYIIIIQLIPYLL